MPNNLLTLVVLMLRRAISIQGGGQTNSRIVRSDDGSRLAIESELHLH
jgi:hypothetical protein